MDAVPDIVVVGSDNSGKTALIYYLAHEDVPFDELPEVMDVLDPIDDSSGVERRFHIHDTANSTLEQQRNRDELLRCASCVILCVPCDHDEALSSLEGYWLPHIDSLRGRDRTLLPILLCVTKADVPANFQSDLESAYQRILVRYETRFWIQYFDTSVVYATNGFKDDSNAINNLFRTALVCCHNPILPLYDPHAKQLTPKCEAALRYIVRRLDDTNAGYLTDAVLCDYQIKCFGLTLTSNEIAYIKQIVADSPGSLTDDKLITEEGFLYLNKTFLRASEERAPASVWEPLRKFGFDNELDLATPKLPTTSPSSRLQLSSQARDHLRSLHARYTSLLNRPGATTPTHLLTREDFSRMLGVVPNVPSALADPPAHSRVEYVRPEGEGAELWALDVESFLALWELSVRISPAGHPTRGAVCGGWFWIIWKNVFDRDAIEFESWQSAGAAEGHVSNERALPARIHPRSQPSDHSGRDPRKCALGGRCVRARLLTDLLRH
eukprot:c9867_g1_i3.p1 GENE.c9867_g1_i3~~c9867_g1_i3.p1  ORF type:complete len:496 (+),score=88.71 c9867_g1_i3:46-1533(+)